MSRRGVRSATLAFVGLLVAAAVAVAAVAPKTSGSYHTGSGNSRKVISFDVVKEGKAFGVGNFGIYCSANANDIGAIFLAKAVKVSASDSFSYKGSAQQYHNGLPEAGAKATLDMSGKFVSSTKVTGRATFATNKKLAGCPKSSYTATWSK